MSLTPEEEREVERVVEERLRDARWQRWTGHVSGWSVLAFVAAIVVVYLYLSRDELTAEAPKPPPPPPPPVEVPDQTRWAHEVVSVSSERLPKQAELYGPATALGEPDVGSLPSCQESGKSWMPDPADTKPQHLEVRLREPVEADAVLIVQTYGAEALSRVVINDGRVVWEGTVDSNACRIARYPLDPPQTVETIRVEVEPERTSPIGIDAVGVVPVGS